MTTITVYTQPCALNQTLYVIQDGTTVESLVTPTDKMSESLFALTDKYAVQQINFVGNENYNKYFGNNFQQLEMKAYQTNDIVINYIVAK